MTDSFTPEQREALRGVLAAEGAPPRVLIEDETGVPRYYVLNAAGDVVEVS